MFKQIVRQYLDRIYDTFKSSDAREESYYTILVKGKTTRWLVRYFDNKQRPTIQLPFPLTEENIKEINRSGLEVGAGDQIIIDRPENILRLSALIIESYQYCSNDENFKRKIQPQQSE